MNSSTQHHTSTHSTAQSSIERGREKPVQGVRLRSLLVALPLVVGISYLSVYADMIAKSVQFGVLQLAPPAVVGLFLLALGNRVLTRLRGREFLSHADCIVIYSMLLISVMVSTRGFIEKLIPPLASLPYYATSENNWNETLTQHLPRFAVPFDPRNASPAPEWIRTYFEAVKPGEAIPFHVWIAPLLMWLVLIFCVLLTFASLATLLRRQWMDNEQLRFPLTTLPLALVRNEVEGQPFFQNRTMWMGFAVSALVFGINGLRANFPDWPELVTFVNSAPYFTERPLNGMDWSPAYISLAAVGFFFFLPTDLLFSLWFFFWLTRVQDVGAVMLGGIPTGIGTHNARVFTGYQAAGAYIVLVIAQIRIAWPYLQQVWRKILHPSTHVFDDSDEMMSYRSAFAGVLLGFAGIVAWLWMAGMSPVVAAAQMGIYIFLIAVIMTRAVSEAGLLMTETSFLPSHLINLVHPVGSLGAGNATMLGLTNIVFVRDLRGVMLTPLMDTQKMAGETRLRLRSLLPTLGLAVVVSYACASYFFLKFSYTLGNLTLYGYPPANARNMFSRAAEATGGFTPPGATEYGGLAVGVAVSSLLVWMRGAFSWFPLHPLAYAIAPTWAMLVFWFPCLVAWIAKSCVLRFGGIDTFRKLAPFALGLILGEFTTAVFWALISMTSPTILGFQFTSAPSFPWP